MWRAGPAALQLVGIIRDFAGAFQPPATVHIVVPVLVLFSRLLKLFHRSSVYKGDPASRIPDFSYFTLTSTTGSVSTGTNQYQY
jgi:hypothetical protein